MLMRPNKAETAVHGCYCPILDPRALVFYHVTDIMRKREELWGRECYCPGAGYGCAHALGTGQTLVWCVSLAFNVVRKFGLVLSNLRNKCPG